MYFIFCDPLYFVIHLFIKLWLRIQGVYDTYFPFNSSKILFIGPNTKKVPKASVLITFYIIKITA